MAPDVFICSRAFVLIGVLLGVAFAPLSQANDSAIADPTRPSGFSENNIARDVASEKLVLTLIRLGAKPQAVINGKTVAIGNTIAGHRLLSLQPNSATLSGPNGPTLLQLVPAIHKTSSPSISKPL